MFTDFEYRARETQRKEKMGGRPAKLKEKKGDGDFKKNCSGGDKMRNASGHQ